MRVVLASGNSGKLRELGSLLAPFGFDLVSQSTLGLQTPPETGTTFAENALLKARHAAAMTNLPALADDSGIEVDALGGRPGIYSARYAGEGASDQANLRKMLDEMREIPASQRTARYQCVIAFVTTATDSAPVLATGTWEGTLISEPKGLGGFGYDPIFVPSGLDRTAAELDAGEKNSLSHRGQALRALVTELQNRRKSPIQ
ncbi:MAG TPA: RdgB/HAM1 family non-canonical purine NTP pyrophosphatase [Steroidobacteraceae bacterium]|nr:RdgB/HAM1 family non-canonical purine NTP pyrophosphatase [Steroidobacteraceae bacterium]